VHDIPEEQVLAEIAQAGYAGAPVDLREGRSAGQTLAMLERHGLRPAPGYLGAAFWDPRQEAQILDLAERLADFHQALGLTEMYVAAGGFEGYTGRSGRTRSQASGQVTVEDGMTDAEYRQFAQTLNQVGAITLARGVRSCFHNHVGSTIETRGEIDRLFDLVDADLVFQGPDIGHLVWAGADPLRFCQDYATSIKTLHVKDIDPRVLEEGVSRGWDYAAFSAHGIFAELGDGCVDFPALFGVLGEAEFAGWVVVETDVTQKATALESATISRDYLRRIGL
jgi:inosose dehydratase